MTVADDIHQMTVDEYMRIVRDFGWESTELVEGVVYDVASEYSRHIVTVMHVFRQLDAHMPENATFNTGTVRFKPLSLFDPDVFVLDGPLPVEPDGPVPGPIVRLVVEVSVTTHSRDRGPKLIAYAKAGVPEVWLIDPLPEVGQLVRYRDPDGASYRTVDRFDVGENAERLDVAAILDR